MIPVVKFADCTPEEIADRIEEMMQGQTLSRTVIVRTTMGETFVGTYERVADGKVEVEVNPVSQQLRRVPCSEVAEFGEYVPPLDRSDEVRG